MTLHKAAKVLESCLDRIDPNYKLSSDVRRLISKPGEYDRDATLNDGNELLSIKFVPDEQVGLGQPALHARWQKSDVIQDASEPGATELTKAGFTVEDYNDDTGPWCYWREKRISHAWIILSQTGWKWSRARSIKAARWESLTTADMPVVPALPGCPHNHRTVLRDSLIEATVKLKQPGMVPRKVWDRPEFNDVMLSLWDSAIAHVEGHTVEEIAVAI